MNIVVVLFSIEELRMKITFHIQRQSEIKKDIDMYKFLLLLQMSKEILYLLMKNELTDR